MLQLQPVGEKGGEGIEACFRIEDKARLKRYVTRTTRHNNQLSGHQVLQQHPKKHSRRALIRDVRGQGSQPLLPGLGKAIVLVCAGLLQLCKLLLVPFIQLTYLSALLFCLRV